jgi:aminoglycoside phosphotransferase (APT) family kinase protein
LFDAAVATEYGVAVAKLHATPVTDTPLRTTRQQEVSWWRQRRQYWGERLDIQRLQRPTNEAVTDVMHCMVHLDLDPQNILIRDGRVLLTAFECASSIGDPALDLLVVLENYRNSGVATGKQAAADRAAEEFVRAYQEQTGRSGLQNVQKAARMLLSPSDTAW